MFVLAVLLPPQPSMVGARTRVDLVMAGTGGDAAGAT